jgi:hypothetical protein
MTAGNTLSLDNTGVTYKKVVQVTYPSKIFTLGGQQVDTLYYDLEGAGATDSGTSAQCTGLYYDTADSNYTVGLAPNTTLNFMIGDNQWSLLCNQNNDVTHHLVKLTEPRLAYPLGTTTRQSFSTWVYGSDETKLGTAGANANSDILNYTGTIDPFSSSAGSKIVWVDSNSALQARANFMSQYGTVVSSGGTSQIVFCLPDTQKKGEVVIGSTATSTETATATLGGDAVTIGGAEISVTGTMTGGAINKWAMPVAKLDSEVTDADKANKNLVLIGGPLSNSLVAALADKLTELDAEITNDDPREEGQSCCG